MYVAIVNLYLWLWLNLYDTKPLKFMQTRCTVWLFDVDNTLESLLVLSGNNNVHDLYNFLLNYRGAHALILII